MDSNIEQLIKMGDRDTLFELMSQSDDWLTQFDAAEALIQLNDSRGYEFAFSATLSDDEEILEVAKEILASPHAQAMRRSIENKQVEEQRTRLETAKKRLQKGGKVFRYKMLYLPSAAIMVNDTPEKAVPVPALDGSGLEGWEVINIMPTRRSTLSSGVDEHFTGAYFLLKKEILSDESSELEV